MLQDYSSVYNRSSQPREGHFKDELGSQIHPDSSCLWRFPRQIFWFISFLLTAVGILEDTVSADAMHTMRQVLKLPVEEAMKIDSEGTLCK